MGHKTELMRAGTVENEAIMNDKVEWIIVQCLKVIPIELLLSYRINLKSLDIYQNF